MDESIFAFNEDEAQSMFFRMLDYESKNLVRNLGSMFIFLFFTAIATAIVFGLTKWMQKRKARGKEEGK